MSSLTEDGLEEVFEKSLPVSLGVHHPEHDFPLRLFNGVSDSNVSKEGLKLVDEGGTIESTVAADDNVIFVWDLDNNMDVVVEGPLDRQLGLVTKVNLTKYTIAEVKL